jgi:hypothetical protein
VASLTTLFLIGLFLFGALTHHKLLFLTRDERAALHWLSTNGAPDALVIAAPQTGLYIPAWTGQRVLYGHRFETANAELRQAQLLALYREGSRALFQENASPQADYVFYGPRERALDNGDWQPDPAWKVVYQQETVTIYALP